MYRSHSSLASSMLTGAHDTLALELGGEGVGEGGGWEGGNGLAFSLMAPIAEGKEGSALSAQVSPLQPPARRTAQHVTSQPGLPSPTVSLFRAQYQLRRHTASPKPLVWYAAKSTMPPQLPLHVTVA